MMRIVMPSIVDPAESRGGAWTVTSGLIKAMSIAWPDAEIACIAERSNSNRSHTLRQLSSVAGSVLNRGLPAKVRFTRTPSMVGRLREALTEGRVDVVVLNGCDLLWARNEVPAHTPMIVVVHNIEHLLFERQLMRLPFGRIATAALTGDLERLRNQELELLSDAAAVIFLSDEDRDFALTALPHLRSAVIPPSFEYEPIIRVRDNRDGLSFGMFADFAWWPNRASLDWFLAEVWPSVHSQHRLELFGHGSQDAAPRVRNVTAHGFVEDPRDAFAGCDLMIAPIIDGAGVKVKVAEAMYNGVPMIATPAAVSGVFERSNPALHVCGDASEWIDFMNGPAASQLATQTVPPDLRDELTVTAAAERLRALLLTQSPR